MLQDLKEVFLPPPHGDDDVPKTPEPPDDDDLHSLSSDVDILLPDEDTKKPKEEGPPKEDFVKDVDPMMFPLYSLDGSTSMHKPCGKLPLVFYWGRKARPVTYNRQVGMEVNLLLLSKDFDLINEVKLWIRYEWLQIERCFTFVQAARTRFSLCICTFFHIKLTLLSLRHLLSL